MKTSVWKAAGALALVALSCVASANDEPDPCYDSYQAALFKKAASMRAQQMRADGIRQLESARRNRGDACAMVTALVGLADNYNDLASLLDRSLPPRMPDRALPLYLEAWKLLKGAHAAGKPMPSFLREVSVSLQGLFEDKRMPAQAEAIQREWAELMLRRVNPSALASERSKVADAETRVARARGENDNGYSLLIALVTAADAYADSTYGSTYDPRRALVLLDEAWKVFLLSITFQANARRV